MRLFNIILTGTVIQVIWLKFSFREGVQHVSDHYKIGPKTTLRHLHLTPRVQVYGIRSAQPAQDAFLG
jgi:hypothetical protein